MCLQKNYRLLKRPHTFDLSTRCQLISRVTLRLEHHYLTFYTCLEKTVNDSLVSKKENEAASQRQDRMCHLWQEAS